MNFASSGYWKFLTFTDESIQWLFVQAHLSQVAKFTKKDDMIFIDITQHIERPDQTVSWSSLIRLYTVCHTITTFDTLYQIAKISWTNLQDYGNLIKAHVC